MRIAGRIGDVYNRSFIVHEDFCPLQEVEIDGLAKDLMLVSKPSFIKILYYDDQVVGFLFVFPDLSAALQRARGRLNPLSLVDLLTEAGRTDTLIVDGTAILPEYLMLADMQTLGGRIYKVHRIYRRDL